MGTDTIVLAHLSDVHLAPVEGFTPATWGVKRTLGWINWHSKRRFVHTRFALDAIVADVHAQNPDHILVSGDLVNIGLPREYEAACDWLLTLGASETVSVVPGNHDAYVAGDARRGISLWRDYMTGWPATQSGEADQAECHGVAFPYVRRVGHVAVIGVNSGVPSKTAIGEVGPKQLARLAHDLERLGQAGLVRVVMIHHPPVPGLATPGRALIDRVALAAVLERHGAELVVHGHNHTLSSVVRGGVRVEGVGSASAARAQRHQPLACYNLIRIRGQGPGAAIQIETRGIAQDGGPLKTIALRTLPLQTNAQILPTGT